MSRRSCADLAELRSAYVDGALTDADRERVLAHLVGCPDCRTEVAELRRVRALLGSQRPPARPASPDLSERLVSIAGADADAPLWTRPFRRTAGGTLPSERGRLRRRAASAMLAAGTVAALVVGVGYVAAPARTWPVVADPQNDAVTDFAAVAGQLPLSSKQAMVAAAVAPSELVGRPEPTPVGADRSRSLSDDQVRQRLVDAYVAAGARSYSGTQIFRAVRGAQEVVTTARIDTWAGQGTRLYVYDRTGHQVVARFFPTAAPARLTEEVSLALLTDNFELTGWTGEWAVSRPATVVEARTHVPSQSLTTDPGRVTARWWLDDATGLVLWQETYDRDGTVLTATGFTALDVGAASDMTHLPAGSSVARTTASLTLSRAGDLRSQGWVCNDELADLSLVRLRSDETANPGVVHVVYSDGVSTLSVFEQRGELAGPPSGSRWDARLGAFVRLGNPSTATWQSDGTVFTVVTDSAPQTLADAVTALPHRGTGDPTTMERVRAGWTRIVKSMSG